jgi:predicted ATP-dependent endonuclease of OLD family
MVPDRTGGPKEVSARVVVLVEGISDKLALEALAERRGRQLGRGLLKLKEAR